MDNKAFEQNVRTVLKKMGYNINATFYADGIVCEDVFRSSKCRPLFILKEVNEEDEEENESKSKYCDFLNSEDIKECKEVTWRKLITLAKGIIDSELHKDYKLISKDDSDVYNTYLNRVAIINLKKLAGGKGCNSDKSIASLHFSKHAELFKCNLKSQIKDINPTVIICCGADVYNCVEDNELVDNMDIVVKGYHPRARVSVSKYYDDVIKKMKKED